MRIQATIDGIFRRGTAVCSKIAGFQEEVSIKLRSIGKGRHLANHGAVDDIGSAAFCTLDHGHTLAVDKFHEEAISQNARRRRNNESDAVALIECHAAAGTAIQRQFPGILVPDISSLRDVSGGRIDLHRTVEEFFSVIGHRIEIHLNDGGRSLQAK